MFVVFQFPFADVRDFVPGHGGRLQVPAWPIASPGRDFIRSSGLVNSRRSGGVSEWAGEDVYGDASSAIRFGDRMRHLEAAAPAAPPMPVRVLHRRFYSDGVVSRMELAVKVSHTVPQPVALVSVMQKLSQLDVRIRRGGTAVASKLIEAGDLLADHFLHATTEHAMAQPADLPRWWLSPGLPSMIVEHDSMAAGPTHVRKVLEIPEAGATLSHAWLQFGKQRCSAWLIRTQAGDRDALRRLRIHLVRLHTERECLKCVLVNLQRTDRLKLEPGSPVSEAIQDYLNDSLRLLNRAQRFGLDQTAMLDAARQAFGAAFEGETASLDKMRRQVALKVEHFIRAASRSMVTNIIEGDYMNTSIQMGNVSVTGDFNLVTAANIENSFNKAASASVDDALKQELKNLTARVADLAKRLPAEEAEQVTRDLVTLTSEATAAKPRKALYDVTASGLLEAAKTVAEMAAPVTTAVKAVLALLP